MARLDDSLTAARLVVLLDPGVLHDVAVSLSGVWHPDDEVDGERRSRLVATARLRLYGGDADRSGWHLVTTAAASLHAAALRADDLDAADPGRAGGAEAPPSLDTTWSAGFVPALESFDDAPEAGDVDTLTALLRTESDLDDDVARTLALALLCEPVHLVVTREPDAYAHRRPDDLPERLEIVDPEAAVARLELQAGEAAWTGPPAGSALADGDAWWVPGAPEGVRPPVASR